MSTVRELPPDKLTDWRETPAVIQPSGDATDESDSQDEEQKPEPAFIYVGEYADKEAYYSPLRDAVVLGKVHGSEFTEEAFLDAPAATGLEEHIINFVETADEEEVEFRLAVQAYALALGERLGQEGLLPTEQAKAYLLRDVFGIERRRAAQLLGVAPSTVDTNRREAGQKITIAQELGEQLDHLQTVADQTV